MSVIEKQGITTDFAKLPSGRGTFFDPDGSAHAIRSDAPIFYLIERGPADHTVDGALLKQASELGVEIRFKSRLEAVEGSGIIASGPKAADAIAVGYHFSTEMDDGYWVIFDDELAPQGYAYLLVWNGRGTVKTCMFSGFKREKEYVDRTVEAFENLVGLEMRNPKEHGGFGNFNIPRSARSGHHLLVGENAGFQDTLWGFGMRFAISSGVLAAQSLLTGADYDETWHRELKPQMQASVVNRCLFSLLGNRNYGRFARQTLARPNPRAALRRHYGLSLFKRLLAPWARRRYRSRRKDESCDHIDCECIWCRHGKNSHPS